MPKLNLVTITTAMIIFCFVTLITFSPSIHFIPYIIAHDCKRVIELLLLFFVLLNASSYVFKPEQLPSIHKNIRISLYLILAIAATSAFNASSPRHAVIEMSMFAALCFLSLFVGMLYRDNEKIAQYLIYALLASIVLYMVSFYVGYTTAMLVGKPFHWPQPFYGFTNVRFFQQYQLWGLGLICIPLLSASLMQNKRNWLFVALSMWWVLLFYGGSRGVILAWLVAMITTIMVYKQLCRPFIRIQSITAFSGFLLYLVFFNLIPMLKGQPIPQIGGGTITRSTSSGRLALWQDALEMISSSPIIGVGPMNYYWHSKLETGTYPHNSVLQTAAEFGLPATFLILFIFGYGLFVWLKQFNAKKLKSESAFTKNLSIILFFTVIANATYSLFSGVTVIAMSQVLMFTVIGIMIGQYLKNHHKSSINNNFKFRPFFALITLIAMAWSTYPELESGLTSYNRELHHNERQFSLGPDTIVPRIWMQQNKIMDAPKE